MDFPRQAASALMHPATLAALCILLANDLVFKALWPGAWVPGKLSDLAWMIFAPPLLAYILSFLTLGSAQRQRAAFAAAYVGLPLLYAAFNTFQPVHDAILGVLGIIAEDGPRSPLDPTDSIVIPLAMAAVLWVWHRPPLKAECIRARLALLAAATAALASIGSAYSGTRGITDVGRTTTGTLAAHAVSVGFCCDEYESKDGGFTWQERDTTTSLEKQEWSLGEVMAPSGESFTLDGENIVRAYEGPEPPEVVYSYGYLQGKGNRWLQGLDKKEIEQREVTTFPYALFYDEQSGNLIVAMGLQGVVLVAPNGTSTQVAVGPYSPTDFSFGKKISALSSSLLQREMAAHTGLAVLMAFSFAALAVAGPVARAGLQASFILGAAASALLAVVVGIYPKAHNPGDVVEIIPVGVFAVALLAFLLTAAELAVARITLKRALAVTITSIGMLMLIVLGALVLFESGTVIAHIVTVGLVLLVTLGLVAHQTRSSSE